MGPTVRERLKIGVEGPRSRELGKVERTFSTSWGTCKKIQQNHSKGKRGYAGETHNMTFKNEPGRVCNAPQGGAITGEKWKNENRESPLRES